MSQYLLDTDTISYFFRGIPSVKSKIESLLLSGETINMSAISYYEICNGLYYKDAKAQLDRFKEFASYCNILSLNQEIADIAAQTFADLRQKGKTVGHTDVLIAATAIYYELELITNNTKHFQDIAFL
ncbi:MAG: type II toxin-antitoxin system VapC family toxin, partial [Bacteroidota bacterium]